jgi:hypothetical protein
MAESAEHRLIRLSLEKEGIMELILLRRLGKRFVLSNKI